MMIHKYAIKSGNAGEGGVKSRKKVATSYMGGPYGQFFLPIMAVTHTHASTFLSFVVTTKRTAEA